MSAATTNAVSPFSGSITRATRDSLIARFRAWNNARLTRIALSNLSDHELADIGLSRYDINTVAKASAY